METFSNQNGRFISHIVQTEQTEQVIQLITNYAFISHIVQTELKRAEIKHSRLVTLYPT